MSFLLPPELWNHVCCFLSPPEIASLALTAHYLLQCVRTELYHTVVLDSDAPSIQETVQLLRRDSSLSRRVRKLVLLTPSDLWHSLRWQGASFASWFDPNIFRAMHALHTVHFRGWPAGPVARGALTDFLLREAFTDMLAEICASARNVTTVQLESVALLDDHAATDYTPTSHIRPRVPVLADIQHVTIHAAGNGGFGWGFVLPTFFFRSPSHIESLDLSFGDHTRHFQTLSTLSFPGLRTLHLRNLRRASSHPLVLFLRAHPSLRYVHLLQCDLSIIPEWLHINMLPNLHTISAEPNLLTTLGMRCDSLRYIRCLYLDCEDTEQMMDFKAMVDATKGFPNLKHIALSRPLLRGLLVAELMTIFHNSVELECWSGGFYVRDTVQVESIVHVISIFPALARLDICEWTYPNVPPLTSSTHLRALHELARAGLALKKIALYQVHLPTNEISAVYDVEAVSPLPTSHAGPGGVQAAGARLALAPPPPSVPVPVAGPSSSSAAVRGGSIALRAVRLRQTYQYVDGGPHLKERRKVNLLSTDWEIETPLLFAS